MTRGTNKPSAIFKGVLDSAKEELLLGSKQSSNFQHKGIIGDERAAKLAEFLRERLPANFRIAKGEAIDHGDRRTGQLDIVVYDADMAAPISEQAENVLVPAESLLAVIEVKTRLTSDELQMCYKSAKKVLSLRPFKKQFTTARVEGQSADDGRLRCSYIVFAYDTNLGKKEWVSKEYSRLGAASTTAKAKIDAIDVVAVLDRGIIRPGSATGKADLGSESTFLEFYLHIVNFLRRELPRRPPMDWQAYTAKTSKNWIKVKDA